MNSKELTDILLRIGSVIFKKTTIESFDSVSVSDDCLYIHHTKSDFEILSNFPKIIECKDSFVISAICVSPKNIEKKIYELAEKLVIGIETDRVLNLELKGFEIQEITFKNDHNGSVLIGSAVIKFSALYDRYFSKNIKESTKIESVNIEY